MSMSYIAEYAKSGRAKCRHCRTGISKDQLRLASIVPESWSDVRWFHVPCFFVKNKGKSLSQYNFRRFDELAEEDQIMLKKYLDGDIDIEQEKNEKGFKEKAGLDGLKNSGEFSIQYAKSNKSHCIICEKGIDKGEIRISQKDYASSMAQRIPGNCLDRWHHVDCFIRSRHQLEFYGSAYSLPGLSNLKDEDREALLLKIPRIDAPEKENRGESYADEEEEENMEDEGEDIY